jgi:hypothetical protein
MSVATRATRTACRHDTVREVKRRNAEPGERSWRCLNCGLRWDTSERSPKAGSQARGSA